jgi:hypothetical protein
VIDQDMVINIELDEAAQRLLYSVVGRPNGEHFPLLLEANYLGQGRWASSPVLAPPCCRARCRWRNWTCRLQQRLERFIDLTEDWTNRLQAAESEPAADT